MMKPFNMYVRTVITGEHDKILLLKQNRMDKKPVWDLPRTPLTEEESFDESVTNNIQKEIGYYIYPGKIIGVSEYNDRNLSEIHVIMEGFIINGELILSKNYEDYGWVPINRLSNYPLAPWLNKYITETDEPFKDVLIEIENMQEKDKQKHELVEEHIFSMPKVNTSIFGSKDKKSSTSNVEIEDTTEKTESKSSVKSSFGLLKDTIKRTFHPRKANVSQTQPKYNPNYDNSYDYPTEEEITPEENVDTSKILHETDDDIIIEHDADEVTSLEEETITIEKPTVRVIRENETPRVRKIKETKEKISFDSNSGSWKNKLNKINRTKANDENKVIPRPKGRKK